MSDDKKLTTPELLEVVRKSRNQLQGLLDEWLPIFDDNTRKIKAAYKAAHKKTEDAEHEELFFELPPRYSYVK